jgi:hypothetical protein
VKYANKIIGYILLLIGLVMIFYPVYNVYQVFKGQTLPYHLFSFKPISIDLSNFVEGAPQNANLNQELVASDLLNKPLDLLAHVILMGFIASAGFKVASLGVMMARTIKVKIKEEESGKPMKPTWK